MTTSSGRVHEQYKYVKVVPKPKQQQTDPTGLGDIVTWGQMRDILCESDSCSEDYSDSSSDEDNNDRSVSEDESPTQVE